MRAILVKEPGGIDQLSLSEVPLPQLPAGHVLIKVKAAGVNRADLFQREGHYPPPEGESPFLGLEVSGVVEKGGTNTHRWKIGDRVFTLLPSGGYAEYVSVPETLLMEIPGNLSFEEAAGVAEVFLTAYQGLVWLAGFQKKQLILIHAGASGVGTATIQLAKNIGGRSIVTVGSEEKIQACLRLGAVAGINYKKEDFAVRVKDITQKKGVNVIFDFIGEPTFYKNIDCLAIDGKLILFAFMGGRIIQNLDLGVLFKKRIQIEGTSLRSRPLPYKEKLINEFSKNCLPLFQNGNLRPVIDRVFPWEDVQKAHRMMEENKNIGKIILKMN